MREILFRGKDIKTGEWRIGFYIKHYNDVDDPEKATTIIYDSKEYRKQGPMSNGGDFVYQVDHATVGQYTGLKDKNGKMIFEGDKIMCMNNGEYELEGVIEFTPPGFSLKVDDKKSPKGCVYLDQFYCAEAFYVKGNIHEED